MYDVLNILITRAIMIHNSIDDVYTNSDMHICKNFTFWEKHGIYRCYQWCIVTEHLKFFKNMHCW